MAGLAARPAWEFGARAIHTRHGLITTRIPIGAVALMLAALVLRVHDIGGESLWRDEGFTLMIAHLPLLRLITVGGVHEHPPLYYAIVHVLLTVHDSYLVPRLVAAVAGSLSVLALYALGARLFNGPTGLIAAAFLAVSPFHLWHSQDGRGYELAGLFVLLSYLWIFSAIGQPCRARWIAYALCTALALYVEYTVAFVLVPQVLFFYRARSRGLTRSLLASWAGVALLYLPWIRTLAANIAKVDAVYWIPAPTLQDVVKTALQMLGLRTACPTLPTCTPIDAPVPFLTGHETAFASVAALAAVATLALAVRRRDFAVSVLVLWLVVPFVVILLVSIRRPIYLDRLFVDATYPLYLLLGLTTVKSVHRFRSLVPVLPVVFALFAANVASVGDTYATTSNPDFKSAAADFRMAYRPGEDVLFYPAEDRLLYEAYLPPGFHMSRVGSIWLTQYLDLGGPGRRYAPVLRRLLRDTRYPVATRYNLADIWLGDRQLSSWVRGRRPVWLLTDDNGGLSYVRRWFLEHGFYLLVSEIYGGETRLELWDRRPPWRFGPAVVPERGFGAGWSRWGSVSVAGRTAVEVGRSALARGFPIEAGHLYTVNVEYRGAPPAGPSVLVETYDRSGRRVGEHRDHFGFLYLGFPRTHWYNLPANDVWLDEPFGFIAPQGAVRGRLVLGNGWGRTSWRHVGVYRGR